MIKIAIVEDEAAVRDQLTDYVRRYTRQYGTEFEVTCFTDGDEILENYRPAFDIIFLDVEMKRLNGMETAQRIRELDDDVLLIFITNMAQYAIKGYSVGALDYVLKPVPYFAFSQQLQKAVNQLARRARHYLAAGADRRGQHAAALRGRIRRDARHGKNHPVCAAHPAARPQLVYPEHQCADQGRNPAARVQERTGIRKAAENSPAGPGICGPVGARSAGQMAAAAGKGRT